MQRGKYLFEAGGLQADFKTVGEELFDRQPNDQQNKKCTEQDLPRFTFLYYVLSPARRITQLWAGGGAKGAIVVLKAIKNARGNIC